MITWLQALIRIVDGCSRPHTAVKRCIDSTLTRHERKPVISHMRDRVALAQTQGINEDYDKAEEDIAAADRELKAYLKEVRGELGAGKEVCFVPLHKETHVIEVPEVRGTEASSIREEIAIFESV